MPRKKIADPKRPKSLSLRESQVRRYEEAAEKLSLSGGLNAFMQYAAEEICDGVLGGDHLDVATALSQQAKLIAEQSQAIQSLTTAVNNLAVRMKGECVHG